MPTSATTQNISGGIVRSDFRYTTKQLKLFQVYFWGPFFGAQFPSISPPTNINSLQFESQPERSEALIVHHFFLPCLSFSALIWSNLYKSQSGFCYHTLSSYIIIFPFTPLKIQNKKGMTITDNAFHKLNYLRCDVLAQDHLNICT